MFKKINTWWNKPWTNGTYIKWTLYALPICIAYYIYCMFAVGIYKFPSKK